MATDTPLAIQKDADFASAELTTAVLLCADCAQPITGSYCAACGQETKIETPTVKHFLQEFADQYIAIEGKLGRTLRVLILQPGQLTVDYIEGRRQRYVRPLKLYLTISVVFFSLLGLLPDSRNPFVRHDANGHTSDIVIDLDDKDDKDDDEPKLPVVPATPASSGKEPVSPTAPAAPAGGFEHRLKAKAKELSKLSPKEQRRVMRDKLADDAPYAMFFLLPYFALLLRLFYRKQKKLYGEHLLFSLHLHSFLFVLLAVGFLPLPAILSTALEIGIGVYVFLALRRVYGGTIKRTLWRMFWLWAFYIIAVAASAVSGVLTVLLNGSPT